MNNKRIIKNIGISMTMKPISIILSLIYTPLALSFLGDMKYGIWAIVLNIVSWINYFDIGIGNGLRNKLAEAIATGDQKSAKTYVSTAYIGTTIISFLFCVIVVLTWKLFHLNDFFNLNVPDENTDLVIFISIFFVCVNFVLSLSKTAAYAKQQPGIISIVGVMNQMLQIGTILVIFKIFNQSLISIALMYGLVSLFDSCIIYFIVTHKNNYLKPAISAIDMKYIRPLLTLGVGFFTLQICSLVLNTTDNLLIANLFGSAEVTPYSIVYKVFYILVQIHGIVIMPMWSAYTEAATKKDIKWISSTMKKINLITVLLSVFAIIGIFTFRPIAKAWLGRELEYSTSLIIMVAIYMIAQMFGNNYSSFLCGVGHIKASVIIAALGATMNIPLSVLFAQNMNMRLTGIILGSLCVMMISVIALPVVAARWKKEKAVEWGKDIE